METLLLTQSRYAALLVRVVVLSALDLDAFRSTGTSI